MKIINRIYKDDGSRVGQCVDDTIVPLVTWVNDATSTILIASQIAPYNLFKVKYGNKYIPLGHPLGEYTTYQETVIEW